MRTLKQFIGVPPFSCCAVLHHHSITSALIERSERASFHHPTSVVLANPGGRACTIKPYPGSLEGGRPASGVPSVPAERNHKTRLRGVWGCQSCAQTQHYQLIGHHQKLLVCYPVAILECLHPNHVFVSCEKSSCRCFVYLMFNQGLCCCQCGNLPVEQQEILQCMM